MIHQTSNSMPSRASTPVAAPLIDDQPSTLHESPYPPRFWWLKRIACAWILFFLFLVALRLWWGHRADRACEAAVRRAADLGTRTRPSEYDGGALPDDRNTVALLEKAGTFTTTSARENEVLDLASGGAKLSEEDLRVVEALRLRNPEVISTFKVAKDLDRVEWKPQQGLSAHRMLCKFIATSVAYFHQIDRDALAVAALDDLHYLADVLAKESTLIGHFVALAGYAQGFRQVEAMAPNLCVTDEEPPQAERCAGREDVRKLIDRLLDQAALRHSAIKAAERELALQLDSIEAMRSGKVSATSLGIGVPAAPSRLARTLLWPFTPLYAFDGAICVDFAIANVRAIRQQTWPKLQAELPAEVGMGGNIVDRTLHPLTSILQFSLERAFWLQFLAIAQQRMAAVAFAIRLYELDHGRRPSELLELVPDYLNAIPIDPFSATGEPIRYRPDAERAILYSIGRNGTDDRGQYQTLSGGRIDYEALDIPFFLDGRPSAD
jgi:hypothetical protein